MTGTTHFITGSAIGKLSGNPFLAAALGFVFHFIMDLVPHWDYGYHFKKTIPSFMLAALDPAIGIAVVVWIIIGRDLSQAVIINMLVGGFFCLLPDILSVFIKLLKIKRLKRLIIFHNKLHWFTKNRPDAFEWKEIKTTPWGIVAGIAWQIPFVAFSLFILLR